MSELQELTYDTITNTFIKALADIDKGTAERDKHFVAATELIIKNFKAHIEECRRPKNPSICHCAKAVSTKLYPVEYAEDSAFHTWDRCCWEYRKALMESLKCTV